MLDKIIEILRRDLDALRAVTQLSPGILAEIRALELVLRSVSANDRDRDEGPRERGLSSPSNDTNA